MDAWSCIQVVDTSRLQILYCTVPYFALPQDRLEMKKRKHWTEKYSKRVTMDPVHSCPYTKCCICSIVYVPYAMNERWY